MRVEKVREVRVRVLKVSRGWVGRRGESEKGRVREKEGRRVREKRG